MVSILVVVEAALRVSEIFTSIQLCQVSILVVVEAALRECDSRCKICLSFLVSILVVVEAALRA